MRFVPILSAFACSTSTPAIVIKHAPPPPCPVTPAALAPPAEVEVAFAFDGTGTAVYVCHAGTWELAGEDAVMVASGDGPMAAHQFGQLTVGADLSSVTTLVLAESVQSASSAPWRLSVVTGHAGPPTGVMSQVTHVQRLATSGGAAPQMACTAATTGVAAQVAFAAQYFFYQTATTPAPHQRCGA